MSNFLTRDKPGTHDQKRSGYKLVSFVTRFAYLSLRVRGLLVALAFFICLSAASDARACGVDSVSAKTDTSITISWDADCNNFFKIEICWKMSANSGNECDTSTAQSAEKTGSYIINGLQAATAYKIKTHWRTKNGTWRNITTRTVTTDPTPTSGVTLLRYEKGPNEPYFVLFSWKNPPHVTTGFELVMIFWAKASNNRKSKDATNAAYNGTTNEFSLLAYGFSNDRKYEACLGRKDTTKKKNNLGCLSNIVEWK